jgi:hypothetical protein
MFTSLTGFEFLYAFQELENIYDFLFAGASGPWNGENTKNCM